MDGVEWVVGDASSPGLIEGAIDSMHTVVWCAGRLLPSSPVESLAEIDDLSPLVTTLRALARQPETRLVFLSSGGTVYGPDAARPTAETEPLAPKTPYAAVKVRSERWIDVFRRDSGVDAVTLRCSNIYGPGQQTGRPQGIVAHALDSIVQERPLELFSDPSSTRDYVFIDDVSQVISACAERRDAPHTMNVGSGRATSLGDVVSVIQQIAGSLSVLRSPPRGIDAAHSELDIGVLQCFMPDFEPVSMSTGLDATWERWPERVSRPARPRDRTHAEHPGSA
jgi:UDP-glucose 4-epimerase